MKDFKQILEKLKNEGYRCTTVRRAILVLLLRHPQPLSYLDIRDLLLRKKIHANKTTIYRELAFLQARDLIEELQLDDRIKRYEIISDHHHHLICLSCHQIQDVKLAKDLAAEEKIITKNKKFKITNHVLEFYGLCQKCQAGVK